MLQEGWAKVEENDGREGVDHQTCYMFGLDAEQHIAELHGELQSGRYNALPLLRLDIPKPGTTNKRMLLIPTVRDRVVQAATAIVLRPLFEAELEHCTFAYRPGLSYLDAVEAVRQLRDKGYQYVVDADITSYFDRINHELLFSRFRELVPDEEVEKLIRQWVKADMIHGYHRVSRSIGLPQGAVVSPMLANLFLDRFDEELTKQGFQLVRYADDCAPRRRIGGRDSSLQPCCTRDEGGPLEAAIQVEASNQPTTAAFKRRGRKRVGKKQDSILSGKS